MKSPTYSAYHFVVYDPQNWDHFWVGYPDGLVAKRRFSKQLPYDGQIQQTAKSLGTPVIFRLTDYARHCYK